MINNAIDQIIDSSYNILHDLLKDDWYSLGILQSRCDALKIEASKNIRSYNSNYQDFKISIYYNDFDENVYAAIAISTFLFAAFELNIRFPGTNKFTILSILSEIILDYRICLSNFLPSDCTNYPPLTVRGTCVGEIEFRLSQRSSVVNNGNKLISKIKNKFLDFSKPQTVNNACGSFVKNVIQASSVGGMYYASFLEREYNSIVNPPIEERGTINVSFALAMYWFSLAIDSGSFAKSQYRLRDNAYALIDFNICMFVIWQYRIFRELEDQALAEAYSTLYTTFLKQIAKKRMGISESAVQEMLNTRIVEYCFESTVLDNVDRRLVKFLQCDFSGNPFATSPPIWEYQQISNLTTDIKQLILNTVRESERVFGEVQ